jgi:hypothetical protein
MPQLGTLVDDATLWVSARALVAGEGYRLAFLPEKPWQTKYPPLYPAYLSLVWRINPDFPSNLPLATLFAWAWMPPFLLLSFLALRRLELTQGEALALTALLGVNPHLLYFASGLHTEVPYTVLLLTALLLLERAGRMEALGPAVLAGVAAGLAFLCRTNGIALVASGVTGLLLARRLQSAAAYALAALPAVAGWSWWSWAHKYTGQNPAVIYHTDYIRFYLETVRWSDLPVLLWGNLGGILIRGGKLIVPTPGESAPERIFCIIVAVLALAGVWRLARRLGPTHYHLYAAGHLLLLLPWNFPANARLLFPLAPLLLAGLFVEARHVVAIARQAMLRQDATQRAVGAMMLACLAMLGLVGAWRWSRPLSEHFPQLSERYRDQQSGVALAYDWITRHTSTEDSFMTWQDGLLFLRTGRAASSPGLSPIPWYTLNRDGVLEEYLSKLADLAATHGRRYVLVADTEFLITDRTDLAYARRRLQADPRLREVYANADAAVFEVTKGGPALAATPENTLPCPGRRAEATPCRFSSSPWPAFGLS